MAEQFLQRAEIDAAAEQISEEVAHRFLDGDRDRVEHVSTPR